MSKKKNLWERAKKVCNNVFFSKRRYYETINSKKTSSLTEIAKNSNIGILVLFSDNKNIKWLKKIINSNNIIIKLNKLLVINKQKYNLLNYFLLFLAIFN